jgi:hypothetical protein
VLQAAATDVGEAVRVKVAVELTVGVALIVGAAPKVGVRDSVVVRVGASGAADDAVGGDAVDVAP